MSRAWKLLALAAMLAAIPAAAQDSREKLGPRDAGAGAAWARQPHPLTALMRQTRSELRPELRGKHPRVFVTEEGIAALRQRARTTHQAMWPRTLDSLHALRHEPPASPAQARRAQNQVGIALAEAALAYRVEGDPRYLAAARKYLDAALSYPVWGYTYNKPNVDLAAGHLLYGVGWAYDLLYHDLTEAERTRIRERLTAQARLLAAYYEVKPGRTYSYSQNHVFIPMAGLGVAAYALYDEVPEAREWAKLARAIYDRVLATYSPDGYYYEGVEYWVFATPWLVHYLDAHAHSTGEDLFDRPGFRNMHRYVAHSILPSGRDVFDFGDTFEGSRTRQRIGDDHARTHPGGRLHLNANLLYRLASRFRDPEAQGVVRWLEGFGAVNAENFWSLLWYDPSVPAAPMTAMQPWVHFQDHGVVFWRTDWTPAATAFAFKSGPPEGHLAAELMRRFPDWHFSMGHAHPDANSFILYADSSYHTGDTGYAGVPMTAHHNTVLVDGKGQAKEGLGHDAFAGFPYQRMTGIRIAEAKLGRGSAYVRGEAAAAYGPELGLERFTRHFYLTHPGRITVCDELRTSQPRRFTTLLHADERIAPAGERRFTLGTGLRATVLAPAAVETRVEPNVLTAPGAPGSVDKGERQERGQVLSVTTTRPATEARFLTVLETGPARGDARMTTTSCPRPDGR